MRACTLWQCTTVYFLAHFGLIMSSPFARPIQSRHGRAWASDDNSSFCMISRLSGCNCRMNCSIRPYSIRKCWMMLLLHDSVIRIQRISPFFAFPAIYNNRIFPGRNMYPATRIHGTHHFIPRFLIAVPPITFSHIKSRRNVRRRGYFFLSREQSVTTFPIAGIFHGACLSHSFVFPLAFTYLFVILIFLNKINFR